MKINFYNNIFGSNQIENKPVKIPPPFAVAKEGEPCRNIFNYFNAIKNYNISKISFSGLKTSEEAIYAIDAHKGFKKFDNPQTTAKAFNTTVNKIIKCANGDLESIDGIMFAFASEVEETGKDGSKVPDTVIIKLASEGLSFSKGRHPTIDEALGLKTKSKEESPHKQKSSAIYAINIANGDWQKFEKSKNASETLEIGASRISSCLTGRIESADGYIFCRDYDIETTDKDGNTVVDKALVERLLAKVKVLNKNNPFNTGNSLLDKIPEEDLSAIAPRYLKKPFYLVDENCCYRKFYLQKNVAPYLGINEYRISDCLQGKSNTVKGFSIIYASEVETFNENGEAVLDIEKLKSKIKNKEPEGFYFVKFDGTCHKFKTVQQAHEKLKIPYNNILSCILGRQNSTGDYIFAKASELEIINEDGTISINEEKLQEIKNKATQGAVYLVDKNEVFKRYDTRAQAAEAIGVNPADISAAALGRKKTIHGYVVLEASEVEINKGNGVRSIDGNKFKEAIAKAQEIRTVDVSEHGFYAIDKAKNYRKFFDITKAQNELGVKHGTIINCLLGYDSSAKGFVFALGQEIDTVNEKGETVPDLEKIAQKAAYFEERAIYAIGTDGTVTRFNNQKEASDTLGIPLKNISRCVNGKIKTTGGYAFLSARDIELKGDDGKTVLNEDLIKEKVLHLNQNIIYAIDSQCNYQKFEDRSSIVDTLGINKSNLAACLKGKQKTVHGYTFVLAMEVEKKLKNGKIVVDEDKIREIVQKAFKKAG